MYRRINDLHKQFNQARALMEKEAEVKECFCSDKENCGKIIKAHSIQKQGPLKILEREVNGNLSVYSFTERVHNEKDLFLDLKPLGRKSASTFFGFCGNHDGRLFNKIENDPGSIDIDSDEDCFLLSYRSFAHSYHRKLETRKLHDSQNPDIVKLLSQMYSQTTIQGIKIGTQMAIDDLEKPKQIIENLRLNQQYEALDYLAMEYPYTVPVAASGITSPHRTYSGVYINLSTDPTYEYSNIITTVLPLKNRSIIILAAFKDEPNGVRYLDEIENIKYEFEQQKFLTFHILNNAENSFLSPELVEKRGYKWRKDLCGLLNVIGDYQEPPLKFSRGFRWNFFDKSSSLVNSI